MGYVFISYSSKNIEAALGVKNVLVKNGIECWMAPECIEAGSNYTSAIPAAIEGCFAFVLVLSGEAQLSQWVTKELDLALNRNRTIVPFHLDSSSMTDQYDFMLAGCQRIEAFTRTSAAYEELIDRLNRLDPNDHYSHAQGDEHLHGNAGEAMNADGGVPQNDANLEHVVKTISADKAARTKKKMPKWAIVLISISAVVACAVVAGIIVVSIKISRAAKQAANQAQEAAQQIKDNITDSGINFDVNSGGMSFSIGGKDSTEKEDKKDSGKESSGDSSDLGGDILGGLLGDDLGAALGLLGNSDALGEALLGTGNSASVDALSLGYTDLLTMSKNMWNASVGNGVEDVKGNEYDNAVLLEAHEEDAGVEFALDKSYVVFIGELSCPDSLSDEDYSWKVRVYADGEVLKEYEMSADSNTQVITLNIEGKKKVSIEIEGMPGKWGGAILSSAYIM